MASEDLAPRSRRALLTAAAGAAGALAAHAALPLTAAATHLPLQAEHENPTVATTSIKQTANGPVAFKATTTVSSAAGLVGSTGDETDISSNTQATGVYGWAPTTASPDIFATGVWGDSGDVGTYGSGYVGVRGDGVYGVIGVGSVGGIGVQATGATATEVALNVTGKVRFSRSGRVTIGAGRSSARVNLAGVSSNSRVFAVLHSNRSGRYVRAVVPTAGSFTIYLNTTVASSTYVAWFVLN
jgi:hypothetical protein